MHCWPVMRQVRILGAPLKPTDQKEPPVKQPTTVKALAHTLNFRHGSNIAQQRILASAQPWDGTSPTDPRQRYTARSFADPDLKISMIYTVDVGPHASGWWRNSDYNACKHLSIVAISPDGYTEVPESELHAWARVWFGDDVTKAWNEPPASEHDPYRNAAASRYTHHIRVFLNQHGEAIIPEGEVYTLKPFDDGTSPEKIYR